MVWSSPKCEFILPPAISLSALSLCSAIKVHLEIFYDRDWTHLQVAIPTRLSNLVDTVLRSG
jgi:hypothetical protein